MHPYLRHLIFACCALSTAHTLPAGEKSCHAWIDLLENDSLAQWQGIGSETPPSAWSIEDGVLHFRKDKGQRGDLITKTDYFNFELKFEWKISQAGNSGVKYRTQGKLGLEYQILDDQGHHDGKYPKHRAASLYALKTAPDDKPIQPVGEWNSSRIIADGQQIEHWLNGEKVMSIVYQSSEWDEAFKKSKYKKHSDFAAKPGPILLQDHNDEVWFRNIRIRPR
jgi:hypothetical protein